MKPVQITEAELEVMKLLWDHSPQSAPELAAKLAERRQWAATTVKTLIARLAKKQALEQSYRGRVSFCRPLIGREEYTEQESDSFLSRFFGGAPAEMISFFVEKRKLSDEDFDTLKKLIAEAEKKCRC